MKPLTTQQWIDLIKISMDMVNTSNGQLRYGQAHINALHQIRPELYEAITETESDCFYNDEKIPKFMKFLNNLND
jgi:hypothetical protein